ncbi:hypothetical protein [Halalkalibacter nanhaiisediminis]|uniref:Secreted protein n=1 Tax=Halalkalibacter nanhaiisediminis TaxID=688079 RepID=A0A562QJ89_9BACI|nr:hypothetical protein [Halalkalibacter nanhaiisediminis]TWI56106.1 hypothetical protein IQ10_01995 [Halalkalibacter nanhaiisediminis]
MQKRFSQMLMALLIVVFAACSVPENEDEIVEPGELIEEGETEPMRDEPIEEPHVEEE